MDLPQLCVFRILSIFQDSSQIPPLPGVVRMHFISSLFCALNTPEFTYSVVLKKIQCGYLWMILSAPITRLEDP